MQKKGFVKDLTRAQERDSYFVVYYTLCTMTVKMSEISVEAQKIFVQEIRKSILLLSDSEIDEIEEVAIKMAARHSQFSGKEETDHVIDMLVEDFQKTVREKPTRRRLHS
jgi:hypothetical protein